MYKGVQCHPLPFEFWGTAPSPSCRRAGVGPRHGTCHDTGHPASASLAFRHKGHGMPSTPKGARSQGCLSILPVH